jgi:Zn-dependent protease with chaperone function
MVLPGWAMALLQSGLNALLARWSRFAEVTADRAGLICCGDRDAAEHLLSRLALGGTSGLLSDLNIDQLVAQLDHIDRMPGRFLEIGASHPSAPRRIAALRHFANSEVLASWRPELGVAAPIGKVELDRRCEQVTNVASVL